MEPGKDQLKQALIKQYSKLNYTSESSLIDKLKSNDWWDKEKYRLKVQHTVSRIGSWIVFIIFLTLIINSFNKGNSANYFYIPLISFSLMVIALLVSTMTKFRIEAKIRQFELLQILFDKK